MWYDNEKVNNNQLIIKLTKLELKQRFTAALKLFIEVMFMMFGGKLFQSLIVLGQNNFIGSEFLVSPLPLPGDRAEQRLRMCKGCGGLGSKMVSICMG